MPVNKSTRSAREVPTQAEMLNDVEHLDGFVERSRLSLLIYDEVDVDVGVDEISVG